MSHQNNGNCQGCLNIFQKYDGFYEPLQTWFFSIQKNNPSFHISCAGRGKIDQEACFSRGASKAHWLQSAHNFNCAVDTFFMIDGNYCLDVNLFDMVVQGLDENIEWYGKPDASFKERPHFEIKNWLQLKDSGVISLVE